MIWISVDPSAQHSAIVELNTMGGLILVKGVTEPVLPVFRTFTDLLASHEREVEAGTIDVIIERPPFSRYGGTKESEQVVATYWMFMWIAESFGIKPASIAPGSWKPAAKAWARNGIIVYPPELKDKHQRDAFAMLRVYLEGKKGSGNGR